MRPGRQLGWRGPRCVAEEEGIEPSNTGIKIRGLTTWRLPYRKLHLHDCRAAVTRPWGTLASSPTQYSEDLQDFYLLEQSRSVLRPAFYGSARSCCCAGRAGLALE